jgi:hypothetical protein
MQNFETEQEAKNFLTTLFYQDQHHAAKKTDLMKQIEEAFDFDPLDFLKRLDPGLLY